MGTDRKIRIVTTTAVFQPGYPGEDAADRLARLGFMDEFPVGVGVHGLHKGVAYAHRDVEVVPAPGRALGANELQHVRVVNPQHAHLRAAPRAGTFHRGA